MRYLAVIFSVVFSVASMLADNLSSADSAYSAGRYADAAALYESVLQEHGSSAPLLCNLGNSYVKSGDYGRAMLAYSRALRIDPSDREVKENMRFVQSKVSDNNKAELKGRKVSVEPDEASFLGAVRDSLTRGVASNTWAVWAAVLFVGLAGCLAAYLFSSAVVIRKIGFFGGIGCAVLSLTALLLSFAARNASERSDEGVVTGYKVAMHVEPDASSKTTPNLVTRGTVMTVLDTRGEGEDRQKWFRVRLNSDFVGWIPATDFELI